MLGLILDFYWKSSHQDPVSVSRVGTLAQLRAVASVNPKSTADRWDRVDVVPIETRTVTSEYSGGELIAHICELHTNEPAFVAEPDA